MSTIDTAITGPAFRAWVARMGMTQQEVGDALGVTRMTISTWCRDGVHPSREKMAGLAMRQLLADKVATSQ